MSDAPYEKECLYCKQKIRMSKESGTWAAYDLNNGPHYCRNKKQVPSKEAKIANIVKNIQAVIGELEALK